MGFFIEAVLLRRRVCRVQGTGIGGLALSVLSWEAANLHLASAFFSILTQCLYNAEYVGIPERRNQNLGQFATNPSQGLHF